MISTNLFIVNDEEFPYRPAHPVISGKETQGQDGDTKPELNQ